jgi:hypothetical protein
MFELTNFRPGDRIELHPATDLWMRGCRYATVRSVGRAYLTVHVDRLGRAVRLAAFNVCQILEA